MLALSALVLVPNYPYGVVFFYSTLGLFFICLGGRGDIHRQHFRGYVPSEKEKTPYDGA